MIFNSYAEHNLQEPTITEGPGFVKTILPCLPIPAGGKAEEADDLRRLSQAFTEFSMSDVIRVLGVSPSTPHRRVSEWLAAGRIVRRGRKRSTR